MLLLRLPLPVLCGSADARSTSRALCAPAQPLQPARLSRLRRLPRAAVLTACAAVDGAVAERYSASAGAQRSEPDAFIQTVVDFLRGCSNGESNTKELAVHLEEACTERPDGAVKLVPLLRKYPQFVAVSSESSRWNGAVVKTVTLVPQAPDTAEQDWAAFFAPPYSSDVPSPRRSWAPCSARTTAQRAYAASLVAPTPYVVAVGPPGTGKTHFAVHAGAAALLSSAVSRLIITRPAVAVDEDLGFLPGGIEQKMAPYLSPIFDLLADIWSASALEQLQEERRLQVVPLGFMRGRTFDDAFILADEMQNCTGVQMRTLLTRLGLRSRLVLTGDPQQCDRTLGDNGMSSLLDSLRTARRTKGAADAAASSLREAVARDFALHELDASSVQRHTAVRTAIRLLGGDS
jgi:hypothetical protein